MGWGANQVDQYPRGMNGRALDRVYTPQPWKAQASCRDVDPDLFYPGPGHLGRQDAAKAKAVCAACKVRLDCLAYAMAHNEEHGIWGGTTEKDRRLLRTALRTIARQPTRRTA